MCYIIYECISGLFVNKYEEFEEYDFPIENSDLKFLKEENNFTVEFPEEKNLHVEFPEENNLHVESPEEKNSDLDDDFCLIDKEL